MSGKGSGRRPGTIPPGAWETIFGKKSEPYKEFLQPDTCDCEPGDCKALTVRSCKDVARRRTPP